MAERFRRGAELVAFLKSFEGAIASFDEEDVRWSLWLPEVAASDRPVPPAAQVYFPVILRHEDRAFAIRFFYDCATGKMKYFPGAVPEELAASPHFENAVSELFRHSLPIEAVRQRPLSHLGRSRPDNPNGADAIVFDRKRPGAVERDSLAEPAEGAPAPTAHRPRNRRAASRHHDDTAHPDVSTISGSGVLLRLVPPVPAEKPAAPIPHRPAAPPEPRVPILHREITLAQAPATLAPAAPHVPVESEKHVRIEIGERAKSLLLAMILAFVFLGFVATAALVYLRVTEDPAVVHHRLQLEAMRLQQQQRLPSP